MESDTAAQTTKCIGQEIAVTVGAIREEDPNPNVKREEAPTKGVQKLVALEPGKSEYF